MSTDKDLKIAELNRQIDRAAKKRDQAADKMGNAFLAMTYQIDIDKLLEKIAALEQATT
jgi:hypothetical protein